VKPASAGIASLALVVASTACRQDRATQIPVEAIDSAGVHIVTYTPDERRLGWRFTERFRLGGKDEGPEAFYRVWPTNVAVDQLGFVYVLDIPNFRLVRFDSTGGLQWAVGSEGGGPGEFQFPAQPLLRSPNEIGVYDFGKRAVLWFDSIGAFQAQWSLRHLGPTQGMVLAGDALLYVRVGRPNSDGSRPLDFVVATPADTMVLASATTAPAASQSYDACGLLGISRPPIFAPRVVWAADRDGLVLTAWASYILNVYRRDGTRLSIRRRTPPLAATEALARREVGDGEPIYIGSSQTCTVPADLVIAKRGFAPTVPFIGELAVGPDGSIWVGRHVFPDESPVTDIFDQRGGYVGTLTGPHPFPVAFLPDGDVLAIETDEFDVQRLVAYRISKE
jgi:hypothetical protein